MDIYNKMGEKNTRKRLIIIGILILLVVGLSGCNENSKKVEDTNKFIGAWEGISFYENVTFNVTLDFYKDNTAKQVTDKVHTHLFNYEIDDNCLYLTLIELPEIDAICYYYEFSNNNSTLTLANESFDTLILTKR